MSKTQPQNTMEIYNLHFPNNVDCFSVGSYKFSRVPDYSDQMNKLSHSYALRAGYDSHNVCDGVHAITAIMEVPKNQKKAILPWQDPNDPKSPKEYLDILLILSLLTGRNVFAKTWDDKKMTQILEDPRKHRGQFWHHCDCVGKARNLKTGDVIDEVKYYDMKASCFDWVQFDAGLEISSNKILATLRDESWQKTYDNGSFLFIFSQSLHYQRIESAFMLSWSIWEHLFTLHNRSWLDANQIERMSGKDKYAFVREKYFGDVAKGKELLKELTQVRNRLMHFGFMPDGVVTKQSQSVNRFFRDTERLVSEIVLHYPVTDIYKNV